MIWINGRIGNPDKVAPHLRVVAIDNSNDIAQVAHKIAAAAMILDSEIDFEFDDRLGFITASPSNLGTAMNIECVIQAPYILEQNHLAIEEKYRLHFTQQEPFEEG